MVVSQERCEICGGTGLKGPLETFANALLLRGWTRVGIQGGRPLLLRHLQAHLDTRIQLTFLGEGPLPKKRSFQLLIRWMDEAGDCSIRHLDIPPSEHTLSSLLRRSAVQVSRC